MVGGVLGDPLRRLGERGEGRGGLDEKSKGPLDPLSVVDISCSMCVVAKGGE